MVTRSTGCERASAGKCRMFVRSMTVHLVKTGTLSQYRFLEHGAFWAIIVLGVIMLISAKYHINETITGLIGATLIALSLAWSIHHNRKNGGDDDAISLENEPA